MDPFDHDSYLGRSRNSSLCWYQYHHRLQTLRWEFHSQGNFVLWSLFVPRWLRGCCNSEEHVGFIRSGDESWTGFWMLVFQSFTRAAICCKFQLSLLLWTIVLITNHQASKTLKMPSNMNIDMLLVMIGLQVLLQLNTLYTSCRLVWDISSLVCSWITGRRTTPSPKAPPLVRGLSRTWPTCDCEVKGLQATNQKVRWSTRVRMGWKSRVWAVLLCFLATTTLCASPLLASRIASQILYTSQMTILTEDLDYLYEAADMGPGQWTDWDALRTSSSAKIHATSSMDVPKIAVN